MKIGKLCLVTGQNQLVGQNRKPWVSIDMKLQIFTLEHSGIDAKALIGER
ncbi:MAG: hypothetical protein K8R90_11315 [Candidatus Cloacimonetes bacterium]|nr:hypothetical protein [Candidatus Cloacimonadota bacterium]